MNAEFQSPPQFPLRAVEYDPARLDERTKSYLKTIRDSRGKGCNGGYCGKGVMWPVVSLILGMIGMAAALYLLSPLFYSDVRDIRGSTFILVRAALLTLGVLLFGGGLRSLLRRRGENFLGDYTFIDSEYLWQVSPNRVRVTPIQTVAECRGTHHLTNGSYNYTSLVFSAPNGYFQLTLNSMAGADEVIKFVNACAHLRSSNDGGLRAAFQQSPELLGEFARRILDNRLSDGLEFGKAPSIPQPTGPAPTNALLRNAPLAMAVAAAALIGFVAFPSIGEIWFETNDYSRAIASSESDLYFVEQYIERFPAGRHIAEVKNLLDDRRFAIAKADSSDANLSALEMYLSDFPQGRHVTEAQNELDDRRWKIAESNATNSHSPTALRDYLADGRNSRHRADAQKLIDGFYDEAIARLKTLGEGQEAVDPQLAGGLLALLESLKTSPRPVVKIGFSAARDLEPQEEIFKTLESQEYAAYLEQNPTLKEIETASATSTAILPVGEVFSDDQVRRRETFILDRLKEAIHKVLDAEIIAFEAAAEGEEPALSVEYHSYPVGGLYLYSRTETTSAGNETTTNRGLLRGYLVDWKLTIHATNDGETFTYELSSKPGESLYYRPDSSDPDWAVYAVIMYSAFHDFSGKLISGFGLEAPTAPVSFSFADATGSNDTSPTVTYETTPSPSYTDPANTYGANPYNIPGIGTNDFNPNSYTTPSFPGFDPTMPKTDTSYLLDPPNNTPFFNQANAFATQAAAELFQAGSDMKDANSLPPAVDPSATNAFDFSAYGVPNPNPTLPDPTLPAGNPLELLKPEIPDSPGAADLTTP